MSGNQELIFLGRAESAELSKIAIELQDADITICTLVLDFFFKDAATRLIDVYARKELDRLVDIGEIQLEDRRRRDLLLSSTPMNRLRDAYFSAIEGALEIPKGNLWHDNKGRTFAGYAPVLASIGTLFASVENPIVVTNKLTGAAPRQAWDVIDTVIQEILQREKGKLVNKLSGLQEIPQHAYDPPEQLTYLAQLVSGQKQVALTDTLRFSNNIDRNKYLESVSQICFEHPFIRSRKMANDVLGSVILAHAVCTGTGVEDETIRPLVRDLAKGPFLWRSIRRELAAREELVVDGQFVGYITASYWNDPLEEIDGNQKLVIQQCGDGLLAVSMGIVGQNGIDFCAVPPLHLYGVVRNAKIDIPGAELTIEGATVERGGSSSLFYFQGESNIRCSELRYRAKWTEFSGSLWLEASKILVMTVDPEVRVAENFGYGWGGAIKNNEPWKHLVDESVANPYFHSPIAHFFSVLQMNVPATGVVLLGDYSVPEDDNHLVWTNRYRGVFGPFIKLLVEKGFADRRSVASRRSDSKFRIMLSRVPWESIQDVCRGNTSDDEGALLLVEAITEAMRGAGLNE